MASYLITGCAGFIGAKVTELLLAQGHDIVGIDSLNNAYDPRLKEWRLAQLEQHPRFTFHRIDIGSRDDLQRVFLTRFDGVINLAARAGVRQSIENPWLYFETNQTGTLNLLELCREFEVAKFVLASSSSVYGDHNPQPFREDADTNRPLSPYAASKKAAEALCYTYHYLYGIDVSVLRYFTVYGPAGRPEMSLFRFVQWIAEGQVVTVYGDGNQSRDFTYIEDIARGTIAALNRVGYQVVNLGSDHPASLRDTIRLIEVELGQKARIAYAPMHPADVVATWADISKARQLLDWQPKTQLDEGIKHLVNWYCENRDWASKIQLP